MNWLVSCTSHFSSVAAQGITLLHKFTMSQFTAQPVPVTEPKITILAFKISYSSRCTCWNKRESNIYFPMRLKSSSSSYTSTDYAWLYRLSHKHSRVTPHTGAAYRHRWYNRVINHWGVYNFIKEPCRIQFTLQPRAPVLWLCGGDIALNGQCSTRNDWPHAL